MMFLVDTNIFLEILLHQDKMERCKRILISGGDRLHISDFTLHSLGIILFRYDKEDVFQSFLQDVADRVPILSLSPRSCREVVGVKKSIGLDFDDSYQYAVARENGLRIITMDRDFEKVLDVGVVFV